MILDDLAFLIEEEGKFLNRVTYEQLAEDKVLALAFSSISSFTCFCLFRYISQFIDHPNPTIRMWANRHLNAYFDMKQKHFREDGTAWN